MYIENDPYFTDEEHEAFEAHLESCAECAREYEESRFIISLVKRYWTVSEDTLALIKKANQSTKHRMTVEEGWEDLKHRIPELAQLENRRKRFRLFHRAGAVAACSAIGVSILLAFSYSTREIAPKPDSQQVVLAGKPSVKIELKLTNDRLAIADNEHMATNNDLKTLIINDKHQMVMDTNTSLSIEPLVKNSRMGCMIILSHGEIYTNIEHDGKPFVVASAHGKTVITGTTFDIKATENSTMLVVCEGTVQFELENGVVNVAAGQKSEIVG